MSANWLELVIDVSGADLEPLEAALTELGALAITLTDAGNEPLLEPQPGETPVWSQVRTIALFAADADVPAISNQLDQAQGGFYQWRTVKNQHWERVWLERFKPRRFGHRLWVVPSNHDVPDADAVNVFLDPGLAFGTGDHPTTALCLSWLDKTSLSGARLLDYGHGSGILAIAAKKLGASEVFGVDIDPQAVTAAESNAARNHLEKGIEFSCHDPVGHFDVIIANILAAPLIGLAQKLSTYLVANGKIALSGILEEQVTDVGEAFAPWIQWQPHESDDGWILMSGVRKPSHGN